MQPSPGAGLADILKKTPIELECLMTQPTWNRDPADLLAINTSSTDQISLFTLQFQGGGEGREREER